MSVTIERIEKTSGVQVQNRAWLKDVYCIYKQVRTRSKSIFYGFTHVCFSDEMRYFVKFMAKVAYLSPSKLNGPERLGSLKNCTLEMSIAEKPEKSRQE